VLEKIVAAVSPSPDDVLIEIGPGEGALTAPLLEKVGRMEAIELDRDLAAKLDFPGLEVHCADALQFDFARFPAGMRLVGNLPYNISTPLLFHLARFAERVRDMHFMLQLEVVERMVAAPASAAYGRLSVALQTRFRMKKLFNVAKGAFRPPPKVESAVVRLEPLGERPALDWQRFDNVLRQAFSARRKTLRNALGLAPEDWVVLGIDPGLRPEALTPTQYVRIVQHMERSQ